MNNPYEIIIRQRATEKARVLANLHNADKVLSSKPSLKACNKPKAVFEVDLKANKSQIKWAIEQIYGAKVDSVNTISIPAKWKRVRGHLGKTSRLKKAVVTFKDKNAIPEQV
jgi:large subunit ribosomal protein L23